MARVMEMTFIFLMRLSLYRLHGGEVQMDVSYLTKVLHGMEQVNWDEIAMWLE